MGNKDYKLGTPERYAIDKYNLPEGSPIIGILAKLSQFDPDLPDYVKIPQEEDPGRKARLERMRHHVNFNDAMMKRK